MAVIATDLSVAIATPFEVNRLRSRLYMGDYESLLKSVVYLVLHTSGLLPRSKSMMV